MKEYFKPTLEYRKTYWKFYASIPSEICDWLKHFIQRGSRGYADKDVWSIDGYFSEIIPDMVRHLKKISHGCPVGLDEKSWDGVLDKIAEGFEASKRIQESSNWVLNEGSTIEVDESGACNELKVTNPWTPEQIKHFRELDEKDNKIFEEGMDLFKKYYFNLWD